jgi:hypothetical protein
VYPGSARTRRTDPTTSHEAADATQSSVAASQTAVLEILTDAVMDLTDEEIAGYLRGRFSPSRVRTARHELEEAGFVVQAGTVKLPGRRTRMRTWRAA